MTRLNGSIELTNSFSIKVLRRLKRSLWHHSILRAKPTNGGSGTTSLLGGRANGDMKSFEEELWALFGPIEFEDFDEALSQIRQVGSV